MMLNVRIVEVYNSIVYYLPIGLMIGAFLFYEIFYIVMADYKFNVIYLDSIPKFINELENYSNAHLIAVVLFNKFYYFIWIIGLLLLLAMIGAIALTIDVDRRDIYKQNNYKHIKLNSNIYFWGFSEKNEYLQKTKLWT